MGAFFAASPGRGPRGLGLGAQSLRGALSKGGMVARYVSGGYGLAPRVVARYEVAPDI